MSIKKSNDTIGNRTHNLLACSAVPQPTVPPNAPVISSHVIVHAIGEQVLIAEAWVQFLGCPSGNYCEQNDRETSFPPPCPYLRYIFSLVNSHSTIATHSFTINSSSHSPTLARNCLIQPQTRIKNKA